MKTRFTSMLGAALCLLVTLTTSHATAQTPSGLAIELDAGRAALTITGVVDTIYQVEYTTEPGQSEGWQTAGVLKLPVSPHRWYDVTSSSADKRFYRAVAVTNIQPVTNMVWIQPGTFVMGSPETEAQRDDDETQHEVVLTRGFWMGRYEVTQAEYPAVVGSNPSYFTNGRSPFAPGIGGAVTNDVLHPVEGVSWFDATNYCGVLTVRERAAGRLPKGWVYRLPTEAEWEYACRAGTTTSHHYRDELRSGMANFNGTVEYDAVVGRIDNAEGEFLGRTREVGSYEPNAWGLYDMHGNVFEWCWDWYGAYPEGPVVDPVGAVSGSYRVDRGGNFNRGGWWCRSAERNGVLPTIPSNRVGFRVVLAPRLILPLMITSQPQPRRVPQGRDATFNVATTGGSGTLTYQWQRDGVDILLANSSALTLFDVQPEHEGEYSVRVTDGLVSIISDAATFTVLVPPTIVQHPQNQTVQVGGDVTFSVTVSSTASLPITYRWRKNRQTQLTQELHQHTFTFTITDVQLSDDGSAYDVVVSNEVNPTGILSDQAVLTVQE